MNPSLFSTPPHPNREPPNFSPPNYKFQVGDLVEVAARTWPGINKPGGAGKVSRVNVDGTYDVSYIVLGGSERRVESKYIRSAQLESGPRIPKERDFFFNYSQRPVRRSTSTPSSSESKRKISNQHPQKYAKKSFDKRREEENEEEQDDDSQEDEEEEEEHKSKKINIESTNEIEKSPKKEIVERKLEFETPTIPIKVTATKKLQDEEEKEIEESTRIMTTNDEKKTLSFPSLLKEEEEEEVVVISPPPIMQEQQQQEVTPIIVNTSRLKKTILISPPITQKIIIPDKDFEQELEYERNKLQNEFRLEQDRLESIFSTKNKFDSTRMEILSKAIDPLFPTYSTKKQNNDQEVELLQRKKEELFTLQRSKAICLRSIQQTKYKRHYGVEPDITAIPIVPVLLSLKKN